MTALSQSPPVSRVLVIDDVLDAARTYALLIEERCAIPTTAYSDPELVIDAIEKGGVEVVVIDQRMPRMSGTALFRKIREKDRFVRAIMLSGEATLDEVADASKLGYDRIVSKRDVSMLPSAVLDLLAEYDIEQSRANRTLVGDAILVDRKFLGRPLGCRVEFVLLQTQQLGTDHVPDDQWVTEADVKNGETLKITYQSVSERKTLFDSELAVMLTTQLGLSDKLVGDFQAGLSSKLTSTLKVAASSTEGHETQKSLDLTLPAAPLERGGAFKTRIAYQAAPIYRVVECLLARLCSACSSRRVFTVRVLHSTGRHAHRCVYHYSDHKTEVLDLGTS